MWYYLSLKRRYIYRWHRLTKNRKKIKSLIGLVPQELHLEAFETVFDNVNYSRGLWGKKKDINTS